MRREELSEAQGPLDEEAPASPADPSASLGPVGLVGWKGKRQGLRLRHSCRETGRSRFGCGLPWHE